MNPNLEFAIAELPQIPDVQVGWASIWADGVSAKSSKAEKEAGWKFLSYLSQKETLRNWYALASKQRLFGEIFARKDMAEQLSTDPFVAAYIKQAPFAKSWYLNSRTYDNGPNDKIIKYYEDAVNAVLKGETAARALATTRDGVTQIVNQYRLPAH
jgi:ABC-type glycerol-3-phosphate transport system substrate-binding protein